MKTSIYILAAMCYIIAVAALAEGIIKGIYVHAIIGCGLMWWIGTSLRKEAKNL